MTNHVQYSQQIRCIVGKVLSALTSHDMWGLPCQRGMLKHKSFTQAKLSHRKRILLSSTFKSVQLGIKTGTVCACGQDEWHSPVFANYG